MKRIVLIVVAILNGFFIQLHAQSYYMHEAAEDSDGDAISGIVSVLIFIGIGVLLNKLFGKDTNENNDGSGYYSESEDTHMDDYDDLLDHDLDYFPEDSYIPPASSVTVENVSIRKSDNLSFREKVLEIYAEQTERFGGLLIIKEDGEYHYLDSHKDDRCNILGDYIWDNKPENCTEKSIRVDWELIRLYKLLHKDEFPAFNDIENAHVEKNDFRGGKLLALKSYYEKAPCYRSHPVHPVDFFISIGFDETILLHKMIKQEMDYTYMHDLKVMLLHGLKTYDEYKIFSNKTLQWQERYDGWYNEQGEYLGSTYDEAHETYFGYTYMRAFEDLRKIKWEI